MCQCNEQWTMSSTDYAAYEIIKYWDAIKTHHQTCSLKQQWTTYNTSNKNWKDLNMTWFQTHVLTQANFEHYFVHILLGNG